VLYGCVAGLKGSRNFERLRRLRLHVHLFRRLSQSGEKGPLSFVMSVRTSAWPRASARLQLDRFT